MVATVHGPTGTARVIGINAPYLIGGKTGTAQVVSNKNNLRLDPHSLPLNLRHQSLFIAFAPAEDPRIAVAVVVEHGGFGASAAAPIARLIMDAYLLPPQAQAALPAARAPGTGGAHAPGPATGTPPRPPPAPALLPPTRPDAGGDATLPAEEDDTGTLPP
jgi:penicillin-binding protein 2